MGLYETKRFGHHHNHGIIMDIVSCITMGFLQKIHGNITRIYGYPTSSAELHPPGPQGPRVLSQLWTSGATWATCLALGRGSVLGSETGTFTSTTSMAISRTDWLEVPILYMFGLFFRPKFQGISPQNMARNMVQYLHFRILKLPLTICLILLGYMGVPQGTPKKLQKSSKIRQF